MSVAVIVNADDFGLTPGVNRGILRAFREGVLTSTTMLVNMPWFDEAAALAREHGEVHAGIHLTLLWGRPVSDPARVPSLVDGEGSLPRGLGTLARRYFTGALELSEVKTEFRAQVERMLAAGVRPTHADTHKHVHCLPGVMGALIEVARETGIERIRLPVERPLRSNGVPRPSWKSVGKRRLIGALCGRSRRALERSGLRTTDHFLGIDHQDRLNSDLLRVIFSRLTEGVTEIMCHPGFVDEHLEAYSGVPPHRERELEGLCDPELRRLVEQRSIRLMHYGEL